MADHGLKVGPPGMNVQDATDDELYYSSEFDSLKAKQFATTTETFLAANTVQTWTYAHGLSYIPAFFGLVKQATGKYGALPFINTFAPFLRVATIQIWADSTNLNIKVSGTVGADLALTFKYYIFYNQID